jgi:hypothetical protein
MIFDLQSVIGRMMLIVIGFVDAFLIAELTLRVIPIPNRFTLQRLLEQQWEPDNELLLRLKPNLI